jgi:hypothetical protein
MMENLYIYCILHLFDWPIPTHFIHLIQSMKEGFVRTVPRCGGGRAAMVAEEEADEDDGGGAGGTWS